MASRSSRWRVLANQDGGFVMKREKLRARPLTSSVEVACPFCGKVESVTIDEGGGEHQTYVEDCSVCCKPRVVHFDSSPEVTSGSGVHVWVERDDGL
jgi:hypothetical protein